MRCPDCGNNMVKDYGDWICQYCDPIEERMDKTLKNNDVINGGTRDEVCDKKED